MDRDQVTAEAAYIKLTLTLTSPEAVDAAADNLIEQLHCIAAAATPWQRASQGHSAPWWNAEVARAVQQACWSKRCY